MDIRIICYALSLMLFSTQIISGEIQKWVDQDGRIHFGDTAPPGTDTSQLSPDIITTAPSHKSLKDILRPGERRMLKRYEQRGRRLRKAKRESVKLARKEQREIAQAEEKCHYHRQKKEGLERRLRQGYKPSKKNSIEEKIARQRLLIKKYWPRQKNSWVVFGTGNAPSA